LCILANIDFLEYKPQDPPRKKGKGKKKKKR